MKLQYKALKNNFFANGEYKLIPLRFEDRYDIMRWRNEQIYHLRQNQLLTTELQDEYFSNVVSQLFDQQFPDQLLFSFLRGEECIAYGGLVHINWADKNAEVSFVMNTALEREEFSNNWTEYLNLIESVAFRNLHFRKLFVYAFDSRPHLYSVLEHNSYFFDARLDEHCFHNDEFKDVVIYSKLNK